MFINKIKQNFAGFAAVAIAFAGFSAMVPATASTAALADPTNMAFTGVKQLTVSGGSATGSITQTNAGRGLLSATFTVDQATADTLVGASINGSLTLTGPNGVVNLGNEGFFSQHLIYALGNTVVGQGPIGSAQAMVWPAGTNHASTNVLISAYINRDSFSFAPGSYTLSATLTKNGVAQTLGSGISLASASIEYRVAGRALSAVDATYSWNSGYVCVDMAQVVAGDVLTVEQLQNATASTGGSIDWYRGGSTMGFAYGNNRAVTSADVTAGNLAMRLYASVGTQGQALSMDPSADASALGGSVATAFTSDPAREDGNNVSLERETLLGQETNLRYSLAVRAVDGRFGVVEPFERQGVARHGQKAEQKHPPDDRLALNPAVGPLGAGARRRCRRACSRTSARRRATRPDPSARSGSRARSAALPA